MVLEDSSSDEHSQTIRRVYENEDLNTTTSLSKVFLLECNYDDVSGKDIILWDDILAAFKNVVHVRAGAKMYYSGQGVSQDDALAIKWFRKSVEQGCATAQFLLGLMHERYHGSSKNNEKAMGWYKIAEEQGYEMAKKKVETLEREDSNV